MILVLVLASVFASPVWGLSRPSKQIEALHTQAIGVQTYSFYDKARERPVMIEFWYPAKESGWAGSSEEEVWIHPTEVRDAPFAASARLIPLIVMSHGHGGDRRDRSWLAEKLVLAGFAVASLDHHGNNWKTLSTVGSLKFWDRAQDVSFAIDCLLKDPRLQGWIDPSRIGFTGYSLGGLTGMAIAGGVAQELEEVIERNMTRFPELTPDILKGIDLSPGKRSYFDPRVKAVFLMAPATWCYSNPKALKSLKTPVAIAATVSDEVLAFDEHMQPLIIQSVPSRLKLLRNGATHFVFLNRASESGRKILGERVFQDPPGVDRNEIHHEIGAFAVDFFKQFLNGITPKNR